jgi:hypothetical protein
MNHVKFDEIDPRIKVGASNFSALAGFCRFCRFRSEYVHVGLARYRIGKRGFSK